MSRIQLVAETPRAGKWNHRFIVAPAGDLSDSEVAKVVAAARRNLQGEDYLAVSVEAAQMLSGRTGREFLVLTGIEVNKLSNSQRQQVMVQLEQRLTELATLVTAKIDWEQEKEEFGLVKRPELVEWEKDFKGLPIAKKAKPPVEKLPARKWHPSQLKLAGGVIGVLLVLALIKIVPWSTKNSESIPKQEQGQTNPPLPTDAVKAATGGKPKSPEEEQPKQLEAEAENQLRKSIKDLQQKLSAVEGCKWKDLKHKKEKTVLLICDHVLKHVKSYTDETKQFKETWCPWIKEVSDTTKLEEDARRQLSNNDEIKFVIDFFQQLSTQPNKEILCPKNTN